MRIAELDRINQLAYQARTVGLTDAEMAERALLRQQYLARIRGQVNNLLSVVTVVDKQGNDVTPMKLRDAQAQGMQVSV